MPLLLDFAMQADVSAAALIAVWESVRDAVEEADRLSSLQQDLYGHPCASPEECRKEWMRVVSPACDGTCALVAHRHQECTIPQLTIAFSSTISGQSQTGRTLLISTHTLFDNASRPSCSSLDGKSRPVELSSCLILSSNPLGCARPPMLH